MLGSFLSFMSGICDEDTPASSGGRLIVQLYNEVSPAIDLRAEVGMQPFLILSGLL